MVKKITKKSIIKVYNTSPQLSPNMIKKYSYIADNYLYFLLSNIFINLPKKDSYLSSLSHKIIEYIVHKEFGIVIQLNQSAINPNHSKELFQFLIIIENKYKNIYDIDPNYFFELIQMLDKQFLCQILNNCHKITKIVQAMLFDDYENGSLIGDYNIFIKSRVMNYINRLDFLTQFKINRLYEYAMKYDENLYYEIINLYPEMNVFKFDISCNRMKYFINPGCIPFKLLKNYSTANMYFLANIINNSKVTDSQQYINNLDALSKLIIIEKYIHDIDFCTNILQSFIIENPCIVKLMLFRKFNPNYIEHVISNVSSFYIGFDTAFALFLRKKDMFYEQIIIKLLLKYPINKNIEKFIKHINKFSQENIDEIEHILDAFEKNK